VSPWLLILAKPVEKELQAAYDRTLHADGYSKESSSPRKIEVRGGAAVRLAKRPVVVEARAAMAIATSKRR